MTAPSTSCTKWPEQDGDWDEDDIWNGNTAPANMDIVCIPAGRKVTVKGKIYDETFVCPAASSVATPRLFIFVCGELIFEASGKLYLGCESAIQIYGSTGKIVAANGTSDLIKIGTKVVWRENNSTLNGPFYLNDGCGPLGCTGDGILPVNLGTLKAIQSRPYTIDLTWSTFSEYNSKEFMVERSSNQVDWTSIGRVDAKGNSQSELTYRFTDKSPVQGMNYYRLRQVDINGAVAYSEIVRMNIVQKGEVSIYPNPAKDKVTIFSKSGFTQGMQVQLYHKNGVILETRNIQSANAQTMDVSN
ncbi:MAG: T9SS type A sorting domain-containing protein, partial [Bacteroidota bacterium]